MKERKHKILVRLLGIPGLKGDLAVEIVRLFSNFKRMLAVVFVLTLITPTMELGFIGSLYVLLSSEKQQQVLNVDFAIKTIPGFTKNYR